MSKLWQTKDRPMKMYIITQCASSYFDITTTRNPEYACWSQPLYMTFPLLCKTRNKLF